MEDGSLLDMLEGVNLSNFVWNLWKKWEISVNKKYFDQASTYQKNFSLNDPMRTYYYKQKLENKNIFLISVWNLIEIDHKLNIIFT